MPSYRLMYGVEHEEDQSVSVRPLGLPEDDQRSIDSALALVQSRVGIMGRTVVPAPMGLFKHLPGVVAVYREEWQSKGREQSRIWIIKQLDTIASRL